MKTLIITSDKAISLQRVSKDIADVLKLNGIDTAVHLGYTLNMDFLTSYNSTLIVMTFDTVWAVPYFYMFWEQRKRKIRSEFYTTIEGKPIETMSSSWIRRDLDFIANSEYTKEKLEEEGYRIKDVIYHGIDIEQAEAVRGDISLIKGWINRDPEKFVVGYIAGCYSRKGHDVLNEVAKIVYEKDKDIDFIVLTTEECKELYGAPNVHVYTLFGKLNDLQILQVYNLFDAYVQASLSEGFGLPVLEALAMGKLVIHPDYKPLSEITTKETSVRVRVLTKTYLDEHTGVKYELHLYAPKAFAEAIIKAKELVQTEGDRIASKCIARAKQFDKHAVYKSFIKYLT